MNEAHGVWALHFTLLNGRTIDCEYVEGGVLVCSDNAVVDKVMDMTFFGDLVSPIGIAPPTPSLPASMDDPVSIAGAVYNVVVSMYDVDDVAYEGSQWLPSDLDLDYDPNALDQWGEDLSQLVASKRLAKDWSEDEHPRGPDGRFLGGDTKEKAGSESRSQSSDREAYHESQKVLRATLESGLSGPVGNRHVRSEVKAEVTADIAARLGSKYDALLGITKDTLVEVDTATGEIVRINSGMGELKDETLARLNEQSKDADADAAFVRATDPEWINACRTDAVSGLVGAWATTSNDANARSLAMQEAAVREFGLANAVGWDYKVAAAQDNPFEQDVDDKAKALEDEVKAEMDQNGEMYQAFLRAQYEATQDYFKANGITEVGVTRGLVVPRDDRPQWSETSGEREVPMRPLSSFTYDEGIAMRFTMNKPDEVPVVLAGLVPVDRVLSCARTGVGCLNEREIVVMAGPGQFNVRTF